MVQAIVNTVDPEKIILFGSRVDRNIHSESDVDLIIIAAENFGPFRSRRAEISKVRAALRQFFVPVDILVYSKDEEADQQTLRCSVIATSASEGRVLYERAA